MTTIVMRELISKLPKKRKLLACLLIGWSLSAQAAPYDEIRQLLTTGRYKAAYEQALLLRSEHEGVPEFDLIFANAALDSGHLSEGVLALERVVSQQPDNHNARLALARGYYLVGDDVRARREFERVLATQPPEQLTRTVQSYLAAIRQREARYETTARAYVQLGIGRDSNINSAPEGGLADNLLPIQLSPDATGSRDPRRTRGGHVVPGDAAPRVPPGRRPAGDRRRGRRGERQPGTSRTTAAVIKKRCQSNRALKRFCEGGA